MPKDPELIVGYHGTEVEIQFVNSVIQNEIRPLIPEGDISLVGSRAENPPNWISKTQFTDAARDLPEDEATHWSTLLNKTAQTEQYTPHELGNLLNLFPEPDDTPLALESVATLFENPEEAASDWDLFVDNFRPDGLKKVYSDSQSGAIVDVYTQDDSL